MKSVINERFADHVQSIAFHLTLSRRMIEALGLLYHYGRIRDCENKFIHNKPERWETPPSVDSHTVPIMSSLERRGLVIHNPMPKRDLTGDYHPVASIWKHKSFLLTEAGEKVCELLILAGLLNKRETKRKTRAA